MTPRPALPTLPIDPIVPQLVDTLATERSLVVEAAPGAGKTTRIPPAFLQAPYLAGKKILVLQPRRLAARLAASRVAEELGEAVGEQVGYQFRFERVAGPSTRVEFLTEGIFLRRILGDPQLADTGLVIIDEFHERHLQGDIALALLRHLQQTSRPDLRLMVMSATLDGESVAAYLDHCPVFRKDVGRFPVDTTYLPDYGDKPLEQRVVDGVRQALDVRFPVQDGHVLVFLPGVGEIRRTQTALTQLEAENDLRVLPLYADLTPAEQEQALRPCPQRKVILATNVAETSLTIEGVTVVIDGGLARSPAHNHWSGLPMLRLARISQASAIQRMGRAGRTVAGHCLRLYSGEDFALRPAFDAPEIARLELTGTLLELKALGIADPFALPWFTPPPADAVESGLRLLVALGALTDEGEITSLGRALTRIPAHPRIGRFLLDAAAAGAAKEAGWVAAWMSAGNPGGGEITDLLDTLVRESGGRKGAHPLARSRTQLLRALPPEASGTMGTSGTTGSSRTTASTETALRKAMLHAFPDRVGRIRSVDHQLSRSRETGTSEVLLCGGGTAQFADRGAGSTHGYIVAVDAEERASQGLRAQQRIRLYADIDPDWLMDVMPSPLDERAEVQWNASQERVEAVSKWMYGKLTLDESRLPDDQVRSSAAARAVLLEQAVAAGLGAFVTGDAWLEWQARLYWAAHTLPEAGFPDFDADGEARVLASLVADKVSFAEIRAAHPLTLAKAALSPEQQRVLEAEFPTQVSLSGGRRLRIHYETERPPWGASRLQDFFGMAAGPHLGRGRLPLVLHLLAPNQRAVQVTTDLAGFWAREYPGLRKELGRRYPRHAWPEDPLRPPPPSERGGSGGKGRGGR